MRVAIVGAGVAGLGAALALARDGHEVVVLERDATPLPATPDEAFGWRRRGAPQVRHSHAFLALMRNLLRDRFPDVRKELLAAGATEVAWSEMLPDTIEDRSPAPGDEDLVMLCCRRTTFEWVLRRAALDTARVELRDGMTVTGYETTEGAGPVRVTGVRTSGGVIGADLVCDATGRPSRLPEMLRGAGVRIEERKSPTGIVYLSRFYRLLDGPPSPQAFNGADLEYLKFAVFRGDNSTFSITLAYDPDDREMGELRRAGRFDAATRAIPATGEWVARGVSEPISGVQYMGNLVNRVRFFVRDGEPAILGLVAVGDAFVCTNPLYGRGCSLALLHGSLLAEAVAAQGDGARSLALAFDEATQRELVPWYVAARQQDKVSMAVARGEELSETDAFVRSVVRDGVLPAARVSAEVSRAWFRTFNLLTPPDGLMTNPEAMRVALAFWNERGSREPPEAAGPGRAEFLDEVRKDV
jgi:2-polyprenyl-6-methoxyphenol hydroxylase-like FAD-dependent oxidoreductase